MKGSQIWRSLETPYYCALVTYGWYHDWSLEIYTKILRASYLSDNTGYHIVTYSIILAQGGIRCVFAIIAHSFQLDLLKKISFPIIAHSLQIDLLKKISFPWRVQDLSICRKLLELEPSIVGETSYLGYSEEILFLGLWTSLRAFFLLRIIFVL